MKSYLLDTDVLTQLARRNPPGTLLQRLSAVHADALTTTTLNVYELRLGCNRQDGRGDMLWARFHEDILSRVRIIPFSERHAIRAGDVLFQLLEAGQTIGVEDSLIAAIAVEEGACLVTPHVAHFSRVPGLEVEDWLS